MKVFVLQEENLTLYRLIEVFMNKFKEEVLKEYLVWVENVSEQLENKTYFTPEEIVSKVVDIVLSKVNTFQYSED